MRWCLLFVFLGLVLSEQAACPQSTDPCSVSKCPCAAFTVVRIQTNSQNAQTTVVVNVTNYCASATGGVYYVNFGLTDGTTTLTPVANVAANPNPFNGQYKWGASTVTTSNPTRTWYQFATPGGGTNDQMVASSGNSPWELFTFVVTGYKPTFGWYFQMHYGSAWDTFGPLDMSLCQCTNCDAGFSQRTIQPCVVGYADSNGNYNVRTNTNRASSIFNENQILYSYGIYNNLLAMFYSDEYPMTLGISTITNNLVTPAEVRKYPFSDGTQDPTCITGSNIKFGQTGSFDGLDPWSAIDGNGPNNGCSETSPSATSGKTCGRPIPPLMFISDITTNRANISGDWQMFGEGQLPAKICGLWQASVKTITGRNADGTYIFSVLPVTTSLPPRNQNQVGTGLPPWSLGLGSDTPPIGFVNPSAVGAVPYLNYYGTEVAWDLDQLGLISTHSYRFQFLVHDGDSTKVGGDVGQACLITTQACPAGFSGSACDLCDTNPLPNDGSWSWFCSNTGTNPPYNLLKLPTEKVNAAPYLGNGFIPSLKFNDTQGYIVGCDCVRKVYTCPQSCCGNGQCFGQNGTCKCDTAPAGTNLTTCCLPPPPPPPPPTCSGNLTRVKGTNCSTCVSNYLGLDCVWCPDVGQNLWLQTAFVNGTCSEAGKCPAQEVKTCIPSPPPPPPVKPPVNPPTALPVYVPVCKDMTNVSFGGNMSCASCVGNKYKIQCAWCPSNATVQPPNRTLTEGVCTTIQGTCKSALLFKCVAPPPPPPPPPIPTCTNVSKLPGINCSTCISNIYSLPCAWCSQPSNKSNGTCAAFGKCGSLVQLSVCVLPCENDGKFCSGHGKCINNTCVCDPQIGTGVGYTGPACNITVFPPPLTCANITGVYNCSDCFAKSAIKGIRCAWCPNSTDPRRLLTSGKCTEDFKCGNSSYYSCTLPTVFVPPECADNCSGHGYCVNISTCKQIQAMENGALIVESTQTDSDGNKIKLIFTCSAQNLNQTLNNNQSSLCACLDPWTGINCGIIGTPINIKLAAGIAAGIIAAIVVLGLLGLALCGGGAAAAASAIAAAPNNGVVANPLYESMGTDADNPLFQS